MQYTLNAKVKVNEQSEMDKSLMVRILENCTGEPPVQESSTPIVQNNTTIECVLVFKRKQSSIRATQ